MRVPIPTTDTQVLITWVGPSWCHFNFSLWTSGKISITRWVQSIFVLVSLRYQVLFWTYFSVFGNPDETLLLVFDILLTSWFFLGSCVQWGLVRVLLPWSHIFLLVLPFKSCFSSGSFILWIGDQLCPQRGNIFFAFLRFLSSFHFGFSGTRECRERQ